MSRPFTADAKFSGEDATARTGPQETALALSVTNEGLHAIPHAAMARIELRDGDKVLWGCVVEDCYGQLLGPAPFAEKYPQFSLTLSVVGLQITPAPQAPPSLEQPWAVPRVVPIDD